MANPDALNQQRASNRLLQPTVKSFDRDGWSSPVNGAKKLLLHSCHNVSKDDFENGATYLSLMEQNVAALKEALN